MTHIVRCNLVPNQKSLATLENCVQVIITNACHGFVLPQAPVIYRKYVYLTTHLSLALSTATSFLIASIWHDLCYSKRQNGTRIMWQNAP